MVHFYYDFKVCLKGSARFRVDNGVFVL
jgi:hypothetical protein